MTIARIATSLRQPRIEKERLLPVEGQDEVNLFTAVLGSSSLSNVQIIDGAGKNKFRGRLEALLADAKIQGVQIRSVGIVRDADTSGARAFQSVCSTLGNLGLPVPTAPRQVAIQMSLY